MAGGSLKPVYLQIDSLLGRIVVYVQRTPSYTHSTDAPAPSRPASDEPAQLDAALLNIAENPIDAMGGDGTFTVSNRLVGGGLGLSADCGAVSRHDSCAWISSAPEAGTRGIHGAAARVSGATGGRSTGRPGQVILL